MTILAVPELRRYAPDLLRVLGVPSGLSDEVAEALTWTEAAGLRAVKFVQENRARLYWNPRPRMRIVTATEQETVVDARGGSLLEFGHRLLDLAQARVSAQGSGVVRIDQTYGERFLPYLRQIARARDFTLYSTVQDTESGTGRINIDLQPTVSALSAEDRRYQSNVNHAQKHGIDMSEDDFRAVTELFEMLRVPTSERSRTHAG